MLLILPYFAEGVVRAWSERGTPAQLALAEAILAVSFFCAAIAYVRSRGK